jgi:hypothetical protein
MAVVWALRRPCRPWPPTASLALLRTASAARVPKAGEGPVKHATARLFHKRRTSTVVMAMRANAGDASSPQSGRTNACIPGNVADPLPRPAPVRRHQVRTRRRQESGDPLPDREKQPAPSQGTRDPHRAGARRRPQASKRGEKAYLETEYGKPFTAAGLGNWFRDLCHGPLQGLSPMASARPARSSAQRTI